ncbi:hypothetical protein K7A41_06645 [Sphingobacterium sp. InxBP1]|uniref:hypothetical protein n=1 Tax=Sphingobacterium sp. InxBP1 TaxID=2870328 RepID=UPI002243F88E|nr:hypothetical protein [Sphingobacterium sp. InxBP1]MCW8310896.1 hypothetical protein [Sphingobacterium sp. InxBP1]
MKIVILDHEPFHDRKINHYYIEEFLSLGYEVEYWALCDILPYMKNARFQYRVRKDYVTYIASIQTLFSKLEKLDSSNSLLIVEIWFLFNTRGIFKKISSKGLKWIKIDYYLNPTKSLEVSPSLTSKLKGVDFDVFFAKIINWGFNRISKHDYAIPDIFYLTGQSLQYAPKARRVISLDYFDVIEYDKKKTQAPLLDYPYIVFLDIMLLDHPDIVMLGKKNVISRSAYYACMNEVFDKIEKCTGLPVVIASHPKATYKNEFGRRLLIANKTAELVIHSDMVLTHGSLSISYALLSMKPIVYLYLDQFFMKDEFLRSIYKSMLRGKELLGAKVISENFSCDCMQGDIDVEKYSNYLANFFCKSEKETSNFITIHNGILELMHEN